MKSKKMKTSTKVYVWGLAQTGALGLARNLQRHKSPQMIMSRYPKRQSFGEFHEVIDAAAGYGFSVFATKPDKDYFNYTLYGTGLNTDSQIGYHKLRGKTYNPMELLIFPAPIDLPKTSPDEIHNIIKVACGRSHTLALKDDGTVFSLGNNAYGQCGREIIEDEVYAGSSIVNTLTSNLFNNEKIVNVVCGQDHSIFITEKGNLYSCGWGADGQTGLGHYNNCHIPTKLEGEINGEKIVKVSSVADCVLALDEKGNVFGWGNSEYNQILVNSDEQQINKPIHLSFLKDLGKIIDIAAGGSFCSVLNEEGDVYVWGYGLIGLGPEVGSCKTPQRIPPPIFGKTTFNPDLKVISINCGLYHLAAINSDNDLFMWGRNKYGCLGIGHKNDQYFPFKSNVGAKVYRILCGVDHSIALCKPFI